MTHQPIHSLSPISDADNDAGALERGSRVDATRARLARDFHIDSEFIGVPKLSRILGIAPSTIYGYMRRGEFFIPYRMFNTTPMVSLDDFARWHCEPSAAALTEPSAPPLPPEAPRRSQTPAAFAADREARADMMVQEALRELGVAPKPRRRRAR